MIKFIKDIFKGTCTGLYSVIRIILSVCLMTSIFYFSYNYLSTKFVNHDLYDGIDFHNLPENSMDIIVLGSSHAQYSYMPAFMHEETGLYSYVLGSACQPYEVSYEMLKEALKTQSPELVVMEVFTATPLSASCEGDSCFVTAAFQMTGEEKYNVLDMLPKEKAKTYYNEFINNHNDWKTKDDFQFLIKQKEEYKGYGMNFGYLENYFKGTENYWYPTIYPETDSNVKLQDIDIQSLNNIKRLCDSQNIQFMLYITPMDAVTEIDQAYRYKIWDWAKKNNVLYQDYDEMCESMDFRMSIHSDGFHAYVNGARLLTHKLAEFIKENYVFNRHTIDEELESKNIEYTKRNAYDVFNSEENPDIYLEELKDYKGLYMFRYVPGMVMKEDLVNKIKNLGFNDFNPKASYYAIVDNGEIVASGMDYAYAKINDVDYLTQSDHMERGCDLLHYDGNLNIVIFNYDFSLYVTKNIEKVKPVWWTGGKEYWEKGYDMYYNKIPQ